MKILYVTDQPPWPARSGYQLRMAQSIEALTELGDVDLAVTIGSRRQPGSAPCDPRIARMIELPVHARGRRAAVAARWAVSADPRVLLRADWSDASSALLSWLRPAYDLVWWSHVPVHRALGHLIDAPSVVDLDDLHGIVLAHRSRGGVLREPRRQRRGAPGLARITRLTDRVDERRWHDLDQRTAATSTAVVVCSDLDRRRLGVANSAVVPNGYPRPERAVRRQPGSRPVLAMIGTLLYEPNIDGAHVFVQHILPRVRAAIPDVEFRLVGKHLRTSDMAWLARQPGVSVIGEVEDVTPELAGANAVVVPLRYGGGTRIKILEAFAHRRPVVSTSVGAEGIDVIGGRHLEIADSVEGFADACIRLLREPVAAVAMADAGHDLYDASYATDRIRPSVHQLAHRVAGSRLPVGIESDRR